MLPAIARSSLHLHLSASMVTLCTMWDQIPSLDMACTSGPASAKPAHKKYLKLMPYSTIRSSIGMRPRKRLRRSLSDGTFSDGIMGHFVMGRFVMGRFVCESF
jgi:hypothetical protein